MNFIPSGHINYVSEMAYEETVWVRVWGSWLGTLANGKEPQFVTRIFVKTSDSSSRGKDFSD